MAIELIEISRNTRGLNSREIKFKAIGRYKDKKVARESKPLFNEDGSPTLDEKGNQKREPLGKDAEGKLITIEETIQEFTSEGVLTSLEDALELVGGDEQRFLDIFAEGFNDYAYRQEADKDELDEFFSDLNLATEKLEGLKRSVRSLAKNTESEILDAAALVKNQILKKLAAATASA